MDPSTVQGSCSQGPVASDKSMFIISSMHQQIIRNHHLKMISNIAVASDLIGHKNSDRNYDNKVQIGGFGGLQKISYIPTHLLTHAKVSNALLDVRKHDHCNQGDCTAR